MTISDLEIIATFDTPQTARNGVKLLNSWFSWIVEGSNDDTEELENLFEFFGLTSEDYSIDEKNDIDWLEIPEAHLEGSKIVISLSSKTGLDTIIDLLESMGAYEVNVCGEDS